MNEVAMDNSYKEAEVLAQPIKYLGLTFLVAIIANLIFVGLFIDSPLMYAVIPFNLAYIFNVAWLARVSYGWFMAIISVVLVVFPIGVFLIMLLALNRASKRIKALGYKAGFTGNLTRNENKLSQNETQNPRSKWRTVVLIVAIVVGVLGLFIYYCILGLASGFANS